MFIPDENPIAIYLKVLERYGVQPKSKNIEGHWLVDVPKGKRQPRNKYLEEYVFRLFSDLGAIHGGQVLKRTCENRYCWNPFHFQVVSKLELNTLSDLDQLEIEELTELIDLDVLEAEGFNNYLSEFNHDNPLPAKPILFYLAANRKLKRYSKPLLSKVVLNLAEEKEKENED